jgi:hypothetical protein
MPDRIRTALGWWLRRLADRIDDEHAPRHPGLSFTFEGADGLKVRRDGRGCTLWFLGKADYELAHSEADCAANRPLTFTELFTDMTMFADTDRRGRS